MSTKKYLDKDVIEQLYVVERKSQRDLAKHFKCSLDLIRSEMIRHNFTVRTTAQVATENVYKNIPPKDELEYLYIDCYMSRDQLKHYFNRNYTTIKAWLKSYDIPIRKKGSEAIIHLSLADVTEKVLARYTLTKMCKYFKCSAPILRRFLKNNDLILDGIVAREYDYDVLYELYVQDELSQREVGDILGSSDTHIIKELRRHNIPSRPPGYGCTKRKNISKGEDELNRFIQSMIIETHQSNRKLIYPYELDIVVPNIKLAFEYNGLYWHSIRFKEIDYHIDKTAQTNSVGYRLIHIFENDWINNQDAIKSKIFNLLSLSNNVQISTITSDEAKKFLRVDNIAQNTYWVASKNNTEIESVLGLAETKPGIFKIITTLSHTKESQYAGLLSYFIDNNNPKIIRGELDLCWYDINDNVLTNNKFALTNQTDPVDISDEGKHPLYNCGTGIYIWSK